MIILSKYNSHILFTFQVELTNHNWILKHKQWIFPHRKQIYDNRKIFFLFELSTKKIFKENSSKYWQEKFAKRNIVNRVRCRRAKLLLFCILSAFLETFWPLLLDGYIRYVFHTVIKVEFLSKNSILAKLYFSTYLNFCAKTQKYSWIF